MDLFRQTAAFDVAIRHFHRLFLAVFICELGQDRPLFSHGRTRTDTDSYSTNNKRTNTDWHLYLEILYITNLRISWIRWSGVLERRSSDDGHEFENYLNKMVRSFGAQELRRWSRIWELPEYDGRV